MKVKSDLNGGVWLSGYMPELQKQFAPKLWDVVCLHASGEQQISVIDFMLLQAQVQQGPGIDEAALDWVAALDEERLKQLQDAAGSGQVAVHTFKVKPGCVYHIPAGWVAVYCAPTADTCVSLQYCYCSPRVELGPFLEHMAASKEPGSVEQQLASTMRTACYEK